MQFELCSKIYTKCQHQCVVSASKYMSVNLRSIIYTHQLILHIPFGIQSASLGIRTQLRHASSHTPLTWQLSDRYDNCMAARLIVWSLGCFAVWAVNCSHLYKHTCTYVFVRCSLLLQYAYYFIGAAHARLPIPRVISN